MKDEIENRSTFGNAMKYFSIFMSCVYLAVGAGLIFFRSNEFLGIASGKGLILGLLFIVYGAFRGFRIYQKYFKNGA
jgi:hypothetical protein